MRFLFSTGSLHTTEAIMRFDAITLELHPDALDAGQADGRLVALRRASVDAPAQEASA